MMQERRKHPRAQVTMQVRLRWPGPLRQTTEITETLDVSRGGLLVYSMDGSQLGRSLWLTFPYENSMTAPEPEILAHVSRVERRPAGGNFIAIRYDGLVSVMAAKPSVERRFLPRTVIGVPVAVRVPACPWPEETMTFDLSSDGLSFITPRVYNVGDTLKVAMRLGVSPAGWGSHGEINAYVVRVAPAPVAPAGPNAPASSNGSPVSQAKSVVAGASAAFERSGSRLSPASLPAAASQPAVSSPSVLLALNDQLVALRRIP
ncbi:MAG TPA: PilZ domain-containing protein [Candidatus Dormibacteraeota bacterium]|nr:PilZ domain-containing protein [Candidatus Dormibacteraeota bacterium]